MFKNSLTGMLLHFCILSLNGYNSQKIEVSPLGGNVPIGEAVNFTCTIRYESTVAIGKISLLKDWSGQAAIKNGGVYNPKNYVLSSQNLPENVSTFTWKVTIPCSSAEDSAAYRCQFSIINLYDSNSPEVRVSVGSKPSFLNLVITDGTNNWNPNELTETSKLKVVCEGSGPNTTLNMTKSGELVSSNVIVPGSNTVTVESPMYDMQQDLMLVHNKNFKCNLKNNWGSLEEQKLLQINHSPKEAMITLNNSTNRVQTTKPGAKLICDAIGFPTPKVWFETTYNKTLFKAGQIESEVVVNDVNQPVVGILECHAENYVGKASKIFTINIDKPSENAGARAMIITGIVIAVILIGLTLISVTLFFFRRHLNR